ncbi:MAG: acyl carrier protein [Gammaproteobacteria bacterium]|nr:acyl carrier protein [Gammaproteobacteria bacterium]
MSNQLEHIRARIVSGLAAASSRSIEINGDTHIVRDLEIDSLAVMNFILALEEEFDISMPLERIAEVETVDDLVATVAALTQQEART